ncbi:hypothetical protein A6P55_25910 (plasmid) [Pandoraea pnomenusa]|nr:hypothetical protein A6P55_25910 [Pandoraea pnomenusa]
MRTPPRPKCGNGGNGWPSPSRSACSAGALGFYGSHLLYGQQQAEQAAFGRAVMATWGDLDAKAKERIQEARRNTP